MADTIQNCSASWFPDVDSTTTAVTAAQSSVFDSLIAFVQDIVNDPTVQPSSPGITAFAESVLWYNVWGFLLFVFFLLALIPVAVCYCCACGKRSQVAYPACGSCCCNGYMYPSISFIVNLVSLVCLAIGVPFALGHFGDVLGDLSCALTAAANEARTMLHDVQVTSDDVFVRVTGGADGTMTYIDSLLDQVSTNTTAINNTVEALCSSMSSGCKQIKASTAYQSLSKLTSSGDFQPVDCSGLDDVAPDVSKQVKQVLNLVQQARQEVTQTNHSARQEIAQSQSEINKYLADASDEVNKLEQTALDYSVDIGTPYPPVIPEPGSYSVLDLAAMVGDALPELGLALCSLTYLGALFWTGAIVTLFCVQAALERAREGRLHAARAAMYSPSAEDAAELGGYPSSSGSTNMESLDRARHARNSGNGCIVNGGCGRSLNIAGCCFGYWGGFLLAVVSIVGLTLAPAIIFLADFYVSAPHNVNESLQLLESSQAIDPVPAGQVENISSIVDVCVFGAENSSLAAAGVYLGYDVAGLIDNAIDFPPVNFSAYGNVTDYVDAAIVAANAVWDSLQSKYTFTKAQMAAADAAADDCCQYEDLFKIWVTDCSNSSSQCYACQSTSAGVCNPGATCSPKAGTVQAQCKAIAEDARSVMQQMNTLVNGQQARFTSIDTDLEKIETVHIETNVNAAIGRFNDLAPSLVAEVDTVSCAGAATVYYGVYSNLLVPAGRYMLRFGGYTAAIAFHVFALAFLTLTVNKRLGSGGVAPQAAVAITTTAHRRVVGAIVVAKVEEVPGADHGRASPVAYQQMR